jgi:phosphoserine aminotransferase
MLPRKVYTFSAGPCVLPLKIMQEMQDNMTTAGKSDLELNPESKQAAELIAENRQLLKKLLSIPDNYEVLFMQGGATFQFASIPINLLTNKEDVGLYLVTGNWSKKAMGECMKYGKAIQINEELNKGEIFSKLGKIIPSKMVKNAKYIYYCDNETVYGVEYSEPPQLSKEIPLITDMTSNFLSKPIDVSKYGIIYAGSQKNYAPAGLCTVIIRKDLINTKCSDKTPSVFHYRNFVDGSRGYCMPPIFALKFMNTYLKWMVSIGGIDAISELSRRKSQLIYKAIERSNGFYKSTVEKEARSRMNIPFIVNNNDKKLTEQILKETAKLDL